MISNSITENERVRCTVTGSIRTYETRAKEPALSNGQSFQGNASNLQAVPELLGGRSCCD
jgi:hypothetical protein